jgi:hypothetical protein
MKPTALYNEPGGTLLNDRGDLALFVTLDGIKPELIAHTKDNREWPPVMNASGGGNSELWLKGAAFVEDHESFMVWAELMVDPPDIEVQIIVVDCFSLEVRSHALISELCGKGQWRARDAFPLPDVGALLFSEEGDIAVIKPAWPFPKLVGARVPVPGAQAIVGYRVEGDRIFADVVEVGLWGADYVPPTRCLDLAALVEGRYIDTDR